MPCKQIETITYIMLQIFCVEFACVSTSGRTGKLAEVEFLYKSMDEPRKYFSSLREIFKQA